MTTPADVPQEPFDATEPHKPADDREEVYFQGSPLLRGEIGRTAMMWVIALLIIAAPFVWGTYNGNWWPWWATLACVVIGLGLILVPVLLSRTMHYRISNYRIDFERGILSKRIDTLELWHVEDVRMQQSLANRLLGVGTITVFSHADRTLPAGELRMYGLPHPRALFDSLKQRIIAVKRQRGVVKIDSMDVHNG